MAYSERIKDFEGIREYMRQFYVYGFRSRESFLRNRSARSYDNERRRVESWLGDYMSFRQDGAGKNVFLSVDSRRIRRNPLYKAFKAKSFTNKDIALHFYILDILADGRPRTAGEIAEEISRSYLPAFPEDWSFDESTVRKKLQEYQRLGLLERERRGRETPYRLAESGVDLDGWRDAAAFFAENAPLGVVGSYLLDRGGQDPVPLRFKHHYILHALDSQVLYELLLAVDQRRRVSVSVRSPRNGHQERREVCPLRIFVSTQTGRQYLLGYRYDRRRLLFFRLDAITRVVPGAAEADFEQYLGYTENFQKKLWGVSIGEGRRTERIEMTVHVDEGEDFIVRRLERERRCGTVEVLDRHTCRFSAEVCDAMELLPWLRTFIGRIVGLTCSNQAVADIFRRDLEELGRMYGGGGDALS
ncbi:MAG: WYL domain-containing protein [Oscillibacter sp.]|nr:WYL domain-containing protein [Oscillibacter sp.]